jgi:signal peptidase I
MKWIEHLKVDDDGDASVGRFGRVRKIVAIVVAIVVIGLLANWQVATIVDVPTMGMFPTFRPNDRVLIDKVGYRLGGLDVGDVVLLSSDVLGPGSDGVTLLRRVVAVGGDSISCTDGTLHRNGRPVASRGPASMKVECNSMTIPSGSIYVLGDNEDAAIDSRKLGPVKESDVEGTVLLRVWPPIR